MKFLKDANIPERKVDIVCIDKNRDKKITDELNTLGIKIIDAEGAEGIVSPVKSHADVVLHHLGENKFVVEPTVFDYFKKAFEGMDANLIMGTSRLENKYPRDSLYNGARIGNSIFFKALDKSILDYDEKIYTRKIKVNQGYSKCSIAVCDKNSFITSDDGIYKAGEENGFNVLKIRPGYIRIKEYDYGFIGGATGLISNDILAFAGDFLTHPDNEDIKSFLRNINIYPYSLSKGSLSDIGSIIPVGYME